MQSKMLILQSKSFGLMDDQDHDYTAKEDYIYLRDCSMLIYGHKNLV